MWPSKEVRLFVLRGGPPLARSGGKRHISCVYSSSAARKRPCIRDRYLCNRPVQYFEEGKRYRISRIGRDRNQQHQKRKIVVITFCSTVRYHIANALLFPAKRNSTLHRPQTWVFLATRVTSARPPVRSAPSTARRGMTDTELFDIGGNRGQRRREYILTGDHLQSVRQGSPALQHPSWYQENPPGPHPWW